MNDLIELLQRIGFGEYEAKAYVALVRRSPLNGYELAKLSGLPRANVYSVLQKLEEKGAVVRVDTPAGPRYAPVPPSELIERLGGHFQDALAAARHALEEVATPVEHEYVWNAQGYAALLDHARTLIGAAEERLLAAIWPQEALALAKNLAQAEDRGVAVTTLCLAACAEECGGCRGQIYRYRVAPEYRSRWLVLVQDEAEMLAGELGPAEDALAVRTRERLLLELAAWYVRHSIALATVVGDLGDRLRAILSPDTLNVLEALGPGGKGGGLLEHMQQMLSRPETEIYLRERYKLLEETEQP
jgi:predicted transcriptional regulator